MADQHRLRGRGPVGRARARPDLGTRDARHVFWFEPTPDGRQRLWRDGRRLRPFDELMPVAAPGPAVLSDAGGRFAYVCRRGEAFFVGADVAEYGPYAGVSTGIVSGPPLRFSADGRHLAFYATIGGRAHLVVDGVPLQRVRPEGSAPMATGVLAASGYGSHGVTFSPDASRMAYVAVAGVGRSAQEWVVIDNVGGPAWDGVAQGPIIFSADGRRIRLRGEAGPTVADGRGRTRATNGRWARRRVVQP